MMHNDPENPISEYEDTINKLTDQITELFSQIHFYQALVAEKDHQIKQLTQENTRLIAQIQNLSQEVETPSYPSQQSYISPPAPPQQTYTPPALPTVKPTSTTSPIDDPRLNKRVCPNCGAMGFAIREVDDKSNVISYIPRRIYAKKKACTKCRFEW